MFFASEIPFVGWILKIAATVMVIRRFKSFMSAHMPQMAWKSVLFTLGGLVAALVFCLNMPVMYTVFQWLSFWAAAFLVISVKAAINRIK